MQLDSAIVSAVLSVMGLLFLATILSVVTSKLKLPFSLTLVAVGLALGIAVRFAPPLEAIASLRLSTELLTYILLPTLVFHAAYAIDSRLLGQNLLPVIVLAVPALVVSFLVAGLGAHWAIGLPLGVALLFGALISSTDSAAVLAVFHDLGAPKRLTVLVEGENLFNDAASIVLFQLVLAGVGLGAATQLQDGVFLRGAGDFAMNFVGGLLLGAAIGHLISKVIEVIENNDLVEILLTTTVAYLSFLAAELVFQMSGVMAVVGTGLVLGGAGITKYSPPTIEYLERFWQYLAFIANSLIFLLIGLQVASDAAIMSGLIGQIGWAILIAIVARAVGIFSLFPIVNRLPNIEKVDSRYQLAIVWGGLRGAVALVLAMSLPLDFQYRSQIIGLTFGVVLFSLLVQGLSLDPLIRMLGLQRSSVPEIFARDDGMLTAKNRARARISELRAAGMFSESVTSELDRSYGAEELAIRERIDQLRERGILGSREEFRLLRREYLLVEKRVYQDLFHRGQVSEKVLRGLQHSIEMQIDHIRYGGMLPAWTIHSPYHWKVEAGVFRFLETLFPWGNVVQHYRLNRIADLYEQHWGRLVASQRVLVELRRIEDEGTNQPELVNELIDLYVVWNENARKRLDAVGEQYPEYATKVQQIMATRLCLQAEEEVIGELERLDVLPEREAKLMRAEVHGKLKRLRQKPLDELRPRPRELLGKVPFFRSLPSAEFDLVVERLRPRTFLADEVIVREGELGQNMFLIGRGVVRVTIGGGGIASLPIATLLAGEFFGEMAVLSGNPRNATVTAVTHCTLYELTRSDLIAVQAFAPTIQQTLEATIAERRVGNANARLAQALRSS